MADNKRPEESNMEEYTAIKEVIVQYELGKDIITVKGNVIIGEGSPFGDFLIIDTDEEQLLCISWTNVITLTAKVPEMFLGKMQDVVEDREMKKIAEAMSKANFLSEISISENKTVNGFQ